MRQWQQIKRKAEKEMDRGHSRLDWFGHQHSSETYRRQTQMVSCSAHCQPSRRTALDDDTRWRYDPYSPVIFLFVIILLSADLYFCLCCDHRLIILIQESHSKVLIGLHICLRMMKVKRFVSCCVKHSMQVWSLPSESHILLVKIMLLSGMIFTTRPVELDSEFFFFQDIFVQLML